LTAAANDVVDGAVRTRIRALFDDAAARSGFVAASSGRTWTWIDPLAL
jgi:hypothetical protein